MGARETGSCHSGSSSPPPLLHVSDPQVTRDHKSPLQPSPRPTRSSLEDWKVPGAGGHPKRLQPEVRQPRSCLPFTTYQSCWFLSEAASPGPVWCLSLSFTLRLQNCSQYFGLHLTRCGFPHTAPMFPARDAPEGCLVIPVLSQQWEDEPPLLVPCYMSGTGRGLCVVFSESDNPTL